MPEPNLGLAEQKGWDHKASSVCATTTHVHSATSCVISSCLREHSLRARARVAEHWIKMVRVRQRSVWEFPLWTHENWLFSLCSQGWPLWSEPSTSPWPFLAEVYWPWLPWPWGGCLLPTWALPCVALKSSSICPSMGLKDFLLWLLGPQHHRGGERSAEGLRLDQAGLQLQTSWLILFPPQKCLSLRIFSSLHTILSALKITLIHWLRMTWGKVSRWEGWTKILPIGAPGWTMDPKDLTMAGCGGSCL